MKELIKEALQKKFAGILKKASPKVLEQLIEHLATKVTEEDKIQDTIDGLDEMVIPFSKYVELLEGEADRRVRQAKDNLKKEFEFVPKTKPEAEPDKPGQPQSQETDIAKLIKEHLDAALQPFTQQISSISESNRKSHLKELFKAKGIPESWADDISLKDVSDLDEVVTNTEKRWNEAKQIAVNLEVDAGRVMRGDSKAPGANIQAIKDYGKSKDLKANGFNIQENI